MFMKPNSNWHIVECSHKRKSSRVQSLTTRKEEFNDDIHGLPDELLQEIFCRIPCGRTATQCKCVCKHWLTLMTQSMRMNTKKRFGLVFRLLEDCWKEAPLFQEHFLFSLESFSLTFVPLPPCVKDGIDDATLVHVVAAWNDLFLCRRSNESNMCSDYCIVNIQTSQAIHLPSPSFYGEADLVGFICDPPFYSHVGGRENDVGGDTSLNSAYRYSIVVIPSPQKKATEYIAHFLSSNTGGQWRERVLSLPRRCKLAPFPHGGVALGGKLYFFFLEGLISFDPYEDDDNGAVILCRLIAWPSGFVPGYSSTVGVCWGHLMISCFNEEDALGVWRLEDYKAGEWQLLHWIAKEDWVSGGGSDDECLLDWRLGRRRRLGGRMRKDNLGVWHRGYVIGFHPINPDVVYMHNDCYIVLCNLRKRTVEVAATIPSDCKVGTNFFSGCDAFPTAFPSLPTPLPPLV